jgi:CheY-like chemotaxis protein
METKNLKVLLVDDDEINQLVACTFLRKWHVDVTIAKDGGQALDLITSKSFHLVMMDLHMPGIDGYECTRQIRAMSDPYFKDIPIILFSASGMIDSRKSATELGMTDFISKPFRQEELKVKLSAYLPFPATGLRKLHIDFDAHTGGDSTFKAELLHLLIDNLNELKRSLDIALATKDGVDFAKTAHKVNSVFGILNDSELTNLFSSVKENISKGNWQAPDFLKVVLDFQRVTSDVGNSLDNEIRVMQKGDSGQSHQ